jgi:hypothetical protein
VILPWQCGDEPRAAGVPTGCYAPGPHHLGYSTLDSHVRRVVADAVAHIEGSLRTGRFDTLAFSWDDRTRLGGRIFETAQDVRDLIVEELQRVVTTS